MRKNRKSKFISLFLILALLLSVLPSYGTVDSEQGSGGGGYGQAYANWKISTNSEQFLRVSIFWTPAVNGQPNWVDGEIRQLGNTYDMASSSRTFKTEPTNFGKFKDGNDSSNNVRWHMKISGSHDKFLPPESNYLEKIPNSTSNKHYVYGPEITTGLTLEEKTNSTTKMAFPLPVNHINNVSLYDYFSQYMAMNEVLYRAYISQNGVEAYEANKASGTLLTTTEFMSGLWVDSMGDREQGFYLISVEPGMYGTINGQSAARTLREMILTPGEKGAYLTSAKNLAVSSYIEGSYPALGVGTLPVSQVPTKADSIGYWYRDGTDKIMLDRMGLAVIQFPAKISGTHKVIKYYYDNVTGELEELAEPASKHTQDTIQGNTYNVKLDEDGYTFQDARIVSKSELAGELELLTNDLKFKNLNNIYELTNEAKEVIEKWLAIDRIDEDLKEEVRQKTNSNNFQNWLSGGNLVTDWSTFNSKSNTNSPWSWNANDLVVNFGTDSSDLELVILYTKKPVDGLTGNPDQVYTRKPDGTTVTKMYFDTEESEPTKKVTEYISVDTTYTVKNEDEYKMKEWAVVEDITKNIPEDYNTWEEVIEKVVNDDKGTTTGDLGPTHWTDPDAELFIKYVKDITPIDPLDAPLLLTEKRISRKYDLTINGTQSLQPVIFERGSAGLHTHKHPGCNCKGGKNGGCKGHTCPKSSGVDTAICYVVKNYNSGDALNENIVGAKGIFEYITKDFSKTGSDSFVYPDDAPEVHSQVVPNIDYVVWRGDDRPTIASYKHQEHELTSTGLSVAKKDFNNFTFDD